MARREDDKCAYGSLFIGQSSRTVASVKVRAGEAGEIRCEIRFAPKTSLGRSWDAPKNQFDGKGVTRRPNSHLAGLLMFS